MSELKTVAITAEYQQGQLLAIGAAVRELVFTLPPAQRAKFNAKIHRLLEDQIERKATTTAGWPDEFVTGFENFLSGLLDPSPR